MTRRVQPTLLRASWIYQSEIPQSHPSPPPRRPAVNPLLCCCLDAAESGAAGGVGSDVPDVVRNFLTNFARRLRQRNVHEIQALYTTEFPRLSERYYKNSAWPNGEVVAELIDKGTSYILHPRHSHTPRRRVRTVTTH